MSPLQRERQSHREKSGGKYAKVNPCYCCGKTAGLDHRSDSRVDDPAHPGFTAAALVLCDKCADKGEAMSDADALQFYTDNGTREWGKVVSS